MDFGVVYTGPDQKKYAKRQSQGQHFFIFMTVICPQTLLVFNKIFKKAKYCST